MGAVNEAPLRIIGTYGNHVGTLSIFLLPGKDPETLWNLRDDPDREPGMEPVQLMEGAEYGYKINLHLPETAGGRVETDRPLILEADHASGRTGRLRPGLCTGSLPVTIFHNGRAVGRVRFEVRSRKLDYLRHYRWMLNDLADHAAEAVMERFAPTEQRFQIDDTRDATTLYQRFAFLKSMVSGEGFETAIGHILARPHRAWVDEDETRAPGQGIPGDSRIVRQLLSASGGRRPWPGGPVPHLPVRMTVERTVETLDTPENRFVQFALMQWRDVAVTLGNALEAEREVDSVSRGLREVEALVEHLDELLSADLFREVGPLAHFPATSQVLQKRAGYREIFRTYIQVESAAAITWGGGNDVFGAGQRNVAALYEYWVFLQLSQVVSSLCTEAYSARSLFQTSPDGLAFTLRRGQQQLVTGVTTRNGRRLRLELWFNRTFWRQHSASWTVPMRPDCSLRIRSERGESAPFEEIWLHFDAKYRIDGLREIFGEPSDPNQADEHRQEVKGAVTRDDLLKMHAYRDAIRRSAGAYVIYPGAEQLPPFTMYDEILPGLGAFPLRPAQGDPPDGLTAVRDFLEDVLDHASSQATEHERERYWVRESHPEKYRVQESGTAASLLTKPPADTLVLLGHVKGPQHLEWIHANRMYNLRAEGRYGGVLPEARELAAELVVLHEPKNNAVEVWRVVGRPQVIREETMRELGYLQPRGTYFCLQLAEVPRYVWPAALTFAWVKEVRDHVRPHLPLGVPVVTSWLDLIKPVRTRCRTF